MDPLPSQVFQEGNPEVTLARGALSERAERIVLCFPVKGRNPAFPGAWKSYRVHCIINENLGHIDAQG